MKFDALSFFIIMDIYDSALKKEETTTWKIANKYKWEDKPEFKSREDKEQFFQKKAMTIHARLRNLSEEGIIRIDVESGERVFTLLEETVLIKRHKFPNGYRDAILIKDKNNKWSAFQL